MSCQPVPPNAQHLSPPGYARRVKFEYAFSSSNRWVDTTGMNQSMGDRNTIFAFARDNGWELVTVAEGTMYFKRPIAA